MGDLDFKTFDPQNRKGKTVLFCLIYVIQRIFYFFISILQTSSDFVLHKPF